MALYEHILLARQDIQTAQAENLAAHFAKIVEDHGGKVAKIEYWGLKSLAYKVKKNRKAHYILMNIDSPHPAVAEMERQERLHEDVLRFMTVRVDALEEGPSIMMQKPKEPRAAKPGFSGRRDFQESRS